MSNPAEVYESYMVPTLFAPWSAYLIQAANPQPGQHILDVGCGTGIVARRVAPLVEPNGRITGLDLNPNMLAVARAAADREHLAIEWREGPAEKLPFPDRGFDSVLSQFAVMFFASRPAALAEMHRVLKNDGRAIISVFQSLDRHPFYQALDEAIQHHLGMSSVSEIFALGHTDKLYKLLTDAGFARVEIHSASMVARFPNPEAFLAGEIEVDTAAIPTMQHLDAQARQSLLSAIRQAMEEPLREATVDNHVTIPFHTYIARAER